MTSRTPEDFASQLFDLASQRVKEDPIQSIFSDSLLDSIWSIDLEIESRNDLISSQAQDTGSAIVIGMDPQDPIPSIVARQRLADLVHQLISASVFTHDQGRRVCDCRERWWNGGRDMYFLSRLLSWLSTCAPSMALKVSVSSQWGPCIRELSSKQDS